ncbi:NAD(P)-dependent dehydrogenase (short-subunit alcohol dehydrogenase family) [Hydrogenivirga caldilitoris]|uniref:NAD(P)-dependent dehydrogenase (Short-subunit alcohol dehydrogenase family) n=1 Tax=Hydrogenivirga caldilitoris TaxID=246264 RepID=A0A497XT98_9AQUI|nr:SDR family oxidoreductase [Hydrogenivirga caldilitoris]RLJ70153.1 NAD(P)-dependent dehydrogenase (short-subunit alcohol dehydrogenase family) [Hydrogenivirga caldilitoris]
MEKVALVTGVRRIGQRIAFELLKSGYDLSIVYRSSEDSVKEVLKEGDRRGRRVLAIRADLGDPQSYERVVKETVNSLSRIDAFLHLASPYRRTPIEELTRGDLYEHFTPIAEAFLFLSKLCYREMLRNEGEIKGRIVAFGDWAVEHTPYRGYSSYFIAKGALHTAVKVLAKEFAPHVLVNGIAPGPVMKPEDMDSGSWKRILSKTPLKREVSLRDVLSITLFFLTTESVTGEIVKVDSGRHLAGSGLGSVEG